jgi:hypothetical protein
MPLPAIRRTSWSKLSRPPQVGGAAGRRARLSGIALVRAPLLAAPHPKKRSDKHDGAKVAASLPLDTAITAIPIDFRAAPVAITGDLLIDAGAHTG